LILCEILFTFTMLAFILFVRCSPQNMLISFSPPML
jgi:hypothetical protein